MYGVILSTLLIIGEIYGSNPKHYSPTNLATFGITELDQGFVQLLFAEVVYPMNWQNISVQR